MDTVIASPPPPEPPRTAEISTPDPSQIEEDSQKDSASAPPPPSPLRTTADLPENPTSHPPAEPPLIVNSISELKSLTLALTSFQQCYDDLVNHLHSIRSSIMAILPSKGSEIPNSSPPQQSPNPNRPSTENPSQKSHDHKNSPSLNKALCGKSMRRYILTHLNDLEKLREEVPHSLKLATNPSKLVLDSLGKFYLQGKKAFERDSPMMASRDASIFILECFLLMMGSCENKDSMDADKSVVDEAEAVAVTWKKRLVTEGGLAVASEVDARGLLMFIACFGVPSTFRRRDVRDLAVVGNGKEISGLLKKSRKFMDKMIEIVEELLKVKMDVDAVNMVYTFGLEEKFNPQTILLTYLRESKASWNSPKQAAPLEGKKKKLAALKSIRETLEKHKIDPAKILPGWQVSENIEKLEKLIESNRKTANKKPPPPQKRKPNGIDPSSSSSSKKKPRPRNPTWPSYLSHAQPPPPQPQQPNKHNSHIVTYSAPPMLYGEAASTALPLPPTHANLYQTQSYYGGMPPVDMSEQQGVVVNHGNYPYQWHAADAGLIEKYLGQPSTAGLYQAQPSMEGIGPSAGAVAQASDVYHYANVVAGIEQRPADFSSSVIAQPPYLYQV